MPRNNPNDLDRLREWAKLETADRTFFLEKAAREVEPIASKFQLSDAVAAEMELYRAADLACAKDPYPASLSGGDGVRAEFASADQWDGATNPFGAEYQRLLNEVRPVPQMIFP